MINPRIFTMLKGMTESCFIACSAGAATYEQDFDSYPDGTTDLGDGTVITGTAASVQGGRLRLTIDGQALGFSSFNVPSLPGSSQGWTASWDYEIFDSPGNNPPADGFSFNYGNFNLNEQGAAEEGMTNRAGVTSNLSLEVDSWMNGDAEQGVNISGLLEGQDPGDLAFTNGVILNDGQRVTGSMTASYNADAGTVTFTTTGLETDANFLDVALPAGVTGEDSWNFGFSARVGGANQDLFIDNLIITTTAAGDDDGDGLSNIYEEANGLDPNDDGTAGESSPGAMDGPNGALGDPDGDSLTNIEERDLGTDPRNNDTDGDDLTDDVEDGGGIYVSASQTGTDPLNPDTDGDTLPDGVENPTLPFVNASQPGTDPNNRDTDGDLTNDGSEITRGRDPTVPDNVENAYIQDFEGFPDGTTDLGDGTVLTGSSARILGGRLQLTQDLVGGGFSSFSIPPLEGSSNGFRASFDIELYDSVGSNPPADGFSFNYGNAPLGDQGNAEEGMNGRPGVSDNLSFEIDTWQNGDAEQGVNISGLANSQDLGQLAFTNGVILNDGQRVTGTVEIEWDPVNGATFNTTGLETDAEFANVNTGDFTGDDSYSFIISARVGGANQDLFIDNLSVTTGSPDDRDNDGLSDSYEIANGLDPDDDGTNGESSPGAKDGPNGALGDPDDDGLTNTEERDLGSNPREADTDGDGLLDGVEDGGGVFVSNTQTGTNPLEPDSDRDGLSDGAEDPTLPFVDASQPGTDPNNADTDGDTVGDNAEITRGSNPTVFNPPPTSYCQNFDSYPNGTTDLGDGTVMAGAAASVENGQLRLTIDGQGLGFSSFSIPGLGGSSKGWTATFDVTLEDGPGANVPADGFSFNYGDAALGILGSAEEGMQGENSVTENLSFEVDTWMNFDTEQGVNISGKAGGVDIGDLAFTNGPILNDGATVTGTVSITWDPVEGATFITTGFDTNAEFINIDTGDFVPDDSHTFVISSRVGGANETLLIDNLCILTGQPTKTQFSLRNVENNLEFTFASETGKVYDILSSSDPQSEPDPTAWAIWQENIPATAPLNVETFARPGEDKLFFVIREKEAPPFFMEDFESGQGGWTTGVNDPDGQTTWELGTPNGSTGPTTGSDGSAGAFTTNLGDYFPNADIFLRSPVIDLTGDGISGATLTMHHYRDADGFGDLFGIRILRAGDLSILGEIDPDSTVFDPEWVPFSEVLPASAVGEEIILEFWFTSDASADAFSGWSIDNVAVEIE